MTHIIGSKPQQRIFSKDELLYDPKIRDAMAVGNSISSIKKHKRLTKIGFTNGKFRVLTPAHCVFLTLCRTKCDILIVGINSDYSLRLLKNPAKFTTSERAFGLASLAPVNYVVPFDEETPYLTISKIQPDIVFKGPDYKEDEVVSAGIPVEIIEHPFDIHVSDILNKKKDKYFDLSGT